MQYKKYHKIEIIEHTMFNWLIPLESEMWKEILHMPWIQLEEASPTLDTTDVES